MIKIAVLDHNPEIGGAEASILTLLRKIDRSQFDVTVVLPSRGTFSEELEKIDIAVKVIDLPMALIRLKRGAALRSLLLIGLYLFRLQFFLMKLCVHLRKNRFDLILTNTVKAHLYGSIAASLCSIPLVWRVHDVLASTDFSPLWIKCIALFGKLFPRRILAVSKVTGQYLVEAGLPSGKIEVIFNGIDQERFGTKDGSNDFRKELGIGNGARLVGCIGRILPQKGQRPFLLAVPEVIKAYPETLFLVIGDVFLREESYKEELSDIVRKNGTGKNVRFTGFRKDIDEVIRSLDVIVFPSVAPESFGLSVLESMSLGKPVIASNTGGVPEIIEDGITGMLVEPDRPEQIVDRVLLLLGNKEIREKIGQKAREVVRKRFSVTPYVKAMETAFKEALSR